MAPVSFAITLASVMHKMNLMLLMLADSADAFDV
jgi:hypothetical protein